MIALEHAVSLGETLRFAFVASGAKCSFQLGRMTTCDGVLAHSRALSCMVSRFHARVSYDEASKQWTVVDLGTANGTYVNGWKITAAPLRTGDTVSFGGPKRVIRDGRSVPNPFVFHVVVTSTAEKRKASEALADVSDVRKRVRVDAPLNDFGDVFDCGVCFELCVAPVVLRCGHTFCETCVCSWERARAARESVRCPLCRETYRPGSYAPNFALRNVLEAVVLPRLSDAEFVEYSNRRLSSAKGVTRTR